MMNFISRLRETRIQSTVEVPSAVYPNVRFLIRRASLGQRIDLARRTAEVMQKNEFLRSGSSLDQVQAQAAELLAQRIFLEWGLVSVHGLRLDGRKPSVAQLIEHGPADLCQEIVGCIRDTLELSENERKNS
jgi:hypothetical protein